MSYRSDETAGQNVTAVFVRIARRVRGSVTDMLPSRGAVFGAHLRSSAVVSAQIVAVSAALWIFAGWWRGLGDHSAVALAVVLCTVLWPPVRWLRSKGIPPRRPLGDAAVAVAVVAGLIAASPRPSWTSPPRWPSRRAPVWCRCATGSAGRR